MTESDRLVIMVSSPVYGIEELLDRIYTLLTTFGYEVWMSHKGTLPVLSSRSAFDNCLAAVEKCDLFLGLITPSYGSGQENAGLSIAHRELLRAIDLNKPRWLLAHDHVVFARKLLNDLGYRGKRGRKGLQLRRKASSVTDLRVIDAYEDAIRDQMPLRDRQGNWSQKFQSDEDAFLFATAQFSRYQEVEAFVEENFAHPDKIREMTASKGGRA